MHPHPQTAPSLQLRLQARPESALLLRERLHLWLDELGAKDEEIFDLSLASTEAFANAIEHPRQPRADVIEVEGSLSGRTITVTVRDHGSWCEQRQRHEGGYGFSLDATTHDRRRSSQACGGNHDHDATTTRQ